MATNRPFRFGLICDDPDASPPHVARRAEAAGYSTVLFPDHIGMLAPMVAMAAAADATERLGVGTLVVNNEFRHLGLLAQEAATVDVLSGGRLELGLGAGHAQGEFDEIGLPFAGAGARVDRLAEALPLLRRLFAGETVTYEGKHHRLTGHTLAPLPPQAARLPILVGGNGTRLLTAAAQHADIVQFTGFSPAGAQSQPALSHFSAAGLADRLGVVRQAAGTRFERLELGALVQRVVIAGDRRTAAERVVSAAEGRLSVEAVLESPFVLAGTLNDVTEKVQALGDRLGVSYLTVFDHRSEGFDQVVGRLA